jgi:hypothetical protein
MAGTIIQNFEYLGVYKDDNVTNKLYNNVVHC